MIKIKLQYTEVPHGKFRQTFLIMLGLSTALFASFHKDANIVTDSMTELQWQDDAIGTKMTWEDAITHCENLSLDGHSDWRLPNLKELISLVDDSRVSPAIDSAFVYTASNSNYYWSSTTNADHSDTAWTIRFSSGYQNYGNKDDNNYVRCVRAGQ